MNVYALLKLVHVASVIAWLGGALAMTLLTWRIERAGDWVGLTALMPRAAFVGPT